MATVEELRDRIQVAHWNGAPQGVPFVEITGLLDSLIAAAREEGRAEGAEQERERIRKAADHYEAEDELPYAELVDGNYVGASCEIYVIPASVLAPDKESEK